MRIIIAFLLMFNIAFAEDIFSIIRQVDSINFSLLNLDSINEREAKDLKDNKDEILESLPQKILNKSYEIGFDVEVNKKQRLEYEVKLQNLAMQKDSKEIAIASMNLNVLNMELKAFNAINEIRKKISLLSSDTLGQKTLAIQISDSVLKDLNAMQKNSKLDDKKYLNTLSTYIEIFTYFKWNPSLFTSQNVVLHSTIHTILNQIDKYIQITNDNLLAIKISLSLLSFIILGACRKLLANIIIRILNLIVHISNQDKELYKTIQKNILKPITLFLFAWSLSVSIDILYYPVLPPDSVSMWFNVCYIINIAWFLIALIKSYVAPILTNLAQKSNEGFRKEVINLILNILYAVVAIIAILFILKDLGFNVSAIIASLGLGGLAVALAIKDMLANFFASVMLLFDNSFSQGDWIECGGIEGNVVEIGLRRTTVRTFDNALLFIPNSELAGKIIKNWSRRKSGRRIKFSIVVAHNNEDKIRNYMSEISKALELDNNIAITSSVNAGSHHLVRKDIVNIDDYLGYKSGFYVCVESVNDKGVSISIDCFTKSISKAEFNKARENLIFRIISLANECDVELA